MKIPQKLHDLAISETGFLFDPYTGSTFSVNDTGLLVLHALRDGLSKGQIEARLRDAFEVSDTTDLDRDIAEFVHLLRRNGLVPEEYNP